MLGFKMNLCLSYNKKIPVEAGIGKDQFSNGFMSA